MLSTGCIHRIRGLSATVSLDSHNGSMELALGLELNRFCVTHVICYMQVHKSEKVVTLVVDSLAQPRVSDTQVRDVQTQKEGHMPAAAGSLPAALFDCDVDTLDLSNGDATPCLDVETGAGDVQCAEAAVRGSVQTAAGAAINQQVVWSQPLLSSSAGAASAQVLQQKTDLMSSWDKDSMPRGAQTARSVGDQGIHQSDQLYRPPAHEDDSSWLANGFFSGVGLLIAEDSTTVNSNPASSAVHDQAQGNRGSAARAGYSPLIDGAMELGLAQVLAATSNHSTSQQMSRSLPQMSGLDHLMAHARHPQDRVVNGLNVVTGDLCGALASRQHSSPLFQPGADSLFSAPLPLSTIDHNAAVEVPHAIASCWTSSDLPNSMGLQLRSASGLLSALGTSTPKSAMDMSSSPQESSSDANTPHAGMFGSKVGGALRAACVTWVLVATCTGFQCKSVVACLGINLSTCGNVRSVLHIYIISLCAVHQSTCAC